MRLVILISVGFLCLDNINYVPALPEPVPVVIEVVDDTRERLAERREWLARESMAYALHDVAEIPGDRAREIVGLVLQEVGKYENLDYQLVLGLIVAESNGNYRATSPVGARGLMQIMPTTGQYIAACFEEEWEGRQSLYEVDRNIRYGVWYLNYLQEKFPNNEQAMVAAYNWGPPNIQKRLGKGHRLPTVYPSKVRDASERIKERMYDYYRTHLWRSLDLDQAPPYFRDDSNEPKTRPGHRELLVHDAESELLRSGQELQHAARRVPGGNGYVSRRRSDVSR